MRNDAHNRRLLLDTSAVIDFLRDQFPENLRDRLSEADWLGLSVVTMIEFRAFAELSDTTLRAFNDFVAEAEVVDLSLDDEVLIDHIIAVRQRFRLKLPDAIIAASAKVNDACLITRDTDFEALSGDGFLQVETF